jgi:hypothetical protein
MSGGLSELTMETGSRSAPPRAEFSLGGMSDVAVGIPDEEYRPSTPKARGSTSTTTSNPSFKLFPNVVGGYFDRLWEQATVVTSNSSGETGPRVQKESAKSPNVTTDTDSDETDIDSVDLELGNVGQEAEDPLPEELEGIHGSKGCVAERRNQVLLFIGLALFLLGLAVGLVIGSETTK